MESDKPSVCMRRIKSQFLHAVEKKIGRIDSGKSQKPHPCKRRKSAAPGRHGIMIRLSGGAIIRGGLGRLGAGVPRSVNLTSIGARELLVTGIV